MVMSSKGREREAEKLMTMGPERSKPLHNFTLPRLKWGNQRFLRCIKVNPNGEVSAVDRRSEVERGVIGRRRDSGKRGSLDLTERLKKSPSPSPAADVEGSGRISKSVSDGDNGIEAIRAKLMFDLQTAADKMKFAILREDLEEETPAHAELPPVAEAVRPWNLRTRRAACKAPNGNGGGAKSLKVEERRPNFSPLRTESKSSRLNCVTQNGNGDEKERAKFSVSLSRREIEEDFMAMLGHRPPRRPKKRAKIVQRQLDSLFPGLWLTEVTADCYKVPETPDTGKR